MLKKIFKRESQEESKKQEVAALIEDAMHCLAQGHEDDAINIVNNAINHNQENQFEPLATISLYETLVKIYQTKENSRMANATRRDMIDYIEREVPELKEGALPAMYELYKAGQYKPEAHNIPTMASLAYQQNAYDDVLRIVGNFAKEHPDHADIGKNYLLVSKALLAQQQPEKAYRLLSGLIKKYPNDAKIMEIKSAFLEAKNLLLQKQKKA